MPESSLNVPEVYFQAQIGLSSSLHTEGELGHFLPALLPCCFVCASGGVWVGGLRKGLVAPWVSSLLALPDSSVAFGIMADLLPILAFGTWVLIGLGSQALDPLCFLTLHCSLGFWLLDLP